MSTSALMLPTFQRQKETKRIRNNSKQRTDTQYWNWDRPSSVYKAALCVFYLNSKIECPRWGCAEAHISTTLPHNKYFFFVFLTIILFFFLYWNRFYARCRGHFSFVSIHSSQWKHWILYLRKCFVREFELMNVWMNQYLK